MATLSDYLRKKVLGDELLRNVRVRGEVTNLRDGRGDSLHFALKEGNALLSCVAWADDHRRFPAFKNGAAIVASGKVDTFRERSTYQLQVEHVELTGVGDIHALFEERKRKLAAEGLFDEGRKRRLPPFPFRIGLVSSKHAAGAKDFEKLLRASRPHVAIVWFEATMQGARAPADIVGALGRASARADLDAIVVTRGGGSFEDLFPFSDENVVRAVARASHPVISAVGHTVDQQLSDFAADVHADTPSRAVELIGLETRRIVERVRDGLKRVRFQAARVFERRQERLERATLRSRLGNPASALAPQRQRFEVASEELVAAFGRDVLARRERIGELEKRLVRHDPSLRLAARQRRLEGIVYRLDGATRARSHERAQRVDAVQGRLLPALRGRLDSSGARLSLARARLDGYDPEAILQQGYAIVTLDGAIVRDARQVEVGAAIAARLARGTLSARVEAKEPDGD
ncbi:MAG TPA: exodeoxyribonuclease VII large subunit [Candidatus Baltobacteraceae bacterium]|nr:exodeoxyribonuclease VII large subunit [Candidatus Baltobacteraceae bacterium]